MGYDPPQPVGSWLSVIIDEGNDVALDHRQCGI
jgi:hypothetical protein